MTKWYNGYIFWAHPIQGVHDRWNKLRTKSAMLISREAHKTIPLFLYAWWSPLLEKASLFLFSYISSLKIFQINNMILSLKLAILNLYTVAVGNTSNPEHIKGVLRKWTPWWVKVSTKYSFTKIHIILSLRSLMLPPPQFTFVIFLSRMMMGTFKWSTRLK